MSCPFSGAAANTSNNGESKCPMSGSSTAAATTANKAPTSYPDAAKANTDTDSGVTVITNLSNKRSSEGMGLPAAMSDTTIKTIVATAPAVAPKLLDITKCFYTKVLGKHPELKQFFNPAHNVPNSDNQPKALAGSVLAYATNITDLTPLLVPGGPVAAICHRHVALAIHPMQYVVVHDNLMEAIGDILGTEVVTPEIAAAWSEAVLFLAKAMIDTEESLYRMVEQREGGWSGFAEFEVSEIVDLTDDVKQISYKPPKGSPLEGKTYEFSAGQYLSLQIDMDGDGLSAPRHYTVTSPYIGAEYLQCTMKRDAKGGKLSNFVHDHLKVGDMVTLSAPVGVFTASEEEEPTCPATTTSVVLLSAGIGVTPMVNLQRHFKKNVKLVVHIDRTPESHPYKTFFEESEAADTLFKYTKVEGGKRPTAVELTKEIIEKAGKDNEFYICGPAHWMEDIQKELLANGAKKVICEVFGSQLATGCPFFQSS